MNDSIRKIFVLCVFLFFFAISSTGTFADSYDFEWEVSDEGVLTITGEGIIPNSFHPWEDPNDDNLNIFSVVFSEGITQLGQNVITEQLYRVQSVTLPSTLKVIERSNFNSLQCETIILPEGLVSIGSNCFSYCTNLKTIIFPSTLESISANCFFNCYNLLSLEFPSSLKTINNSFVRCSALTSVTIPSSLTMITDNTFLDCPSIQYFYVDESNPYYQSRNGVLYHIHDGQIELMRYPLGNTSSVYTIPSDTTIIGNGAFKNSQALISIVLPKGLQQILGQSFENCKLLKEITIPDTVTFIEAHSFLGCSSLTSISIPDSVIRFGNPQNGGYADPTVFSSWITIICSKGSAADEYAKQNGLQVVYINDLTIAYLPNALTQIAQEAFWESNFDAVYISSNVTQIGENAFSLHTIIICPYDSFADQWARSRGYSVIND